MLNIDTILFQFIHQLSGKIMIIDWLAIFFAKYVPYLLVLWLIILLLREKKWKERYYIFFFSILSVIISRGIITEVIRFFYDRARPFAYFNFEPLINHSANFAFPSGHAAAFFALVLPVFYLSKKAGWWFLAITAIMAVSRIFTGIHWPLDILVGAIIGIGSSYFVKLLLPKSLYKNNGPTV